MIQCSIHNRQQSITNSYSTTEQWTQRITFAAEVNAADTHTAWRRASQYLRSLSGGEGKNKHQCENNYSLRTLKLRKTVTLQLQHTLETCRKAQLICRSANDDGDQTGCSALHTVIHHFPSTDSKQTWLILANKMTMVGADTSSLQAGSQPKLADLVHETAAAA